MEPRPRRERQPDVRYPVCHGSALPAGSPPGAAGMIDDRQRREAVEFLRTHMCADEGSAYRTVGDCPGCIRASRALFGNDDALCNLDSSGPGMWTRLADLIDNRR